jgi:hypothetical protein
MALPRVVRESESRVRPPTPRSAARTSATRAARAAAVTTRAARAAAVTTLALAAVSWVVAIDRMNGMDMGVATELGACGFFITAWIPMTAARMLPGAAPAVARRARSDGSAVAVPLFLFVPGRVDAGRYRRLRRVRAARNDGCGRADDRSRALRAHTAEAHVAATLPRRGPVTSSVRAFMRRVEHRPDADVRGAGRHERHLDGS